MRKPRWVLGLIFALAAVAGAGSAYAEEGVWCGGSGFCWGSGQCDGRCYNFSCGSDICQDLGDPQGGGITCTICVE